MNPDKTTEKKFNEYAKVYVNAEYACHQSYRSLCIINSIAEQYNTKVYIFEWLIPDIFRILHGKFKNITHIPISTLDQKQFLKSTPYVSSLTFARDNVHPGPGWQYMLSEKIWENIKSEFVIPTGKLVQNRIVTK
jgi:hypothetical protein